MSIKLIFFKTILWKFCERRKELKGNSELNKRTYSNQFSAENTQILSLKCLLSSVLSQQEIVLLQYFSQNQNTEKDKRNMWIEKDFLIMFYFFSHKVFFSYFLLSFFNLNQKKEARKICTFSFLSLKQTNHYNIMQYHFV